MAIYYFDINASNDGAPEQDGSPEHPWDFDKFKNLSIFGQDHTFRVRGSRSVSLSSINASAYSGTVCAWDVSLYGPWCIKNTTGAINVLGGPASDITFIIKDAILEAPLLNFTGSGTGNSNAYIYNCIFVGTSKFYKGGPPSTHLFECYGCRFDGGLIIESSNGPWSNITRFIDTVLNISSITGTASTASASFKNVATNLSTLESPPLSVSILGPVQYNWTSVALPPWGSPKESYAYNTLSAGITTPPQPGNPPYTGYGTDLWGNPRIGIGNGYMLAGEPDISVSPSILNFGLQDIKEPKRMQVTVTNIGSADLTIEPVPKLKYPYAIVEDNVSGKTLAPSESATLTVEFCPSFVGNYRSTLRINSDDPDTPAAVIPIIGDGQEPDIMILRTGSRDLCVNPFEVRDYIA